jgi:hypothetical protein
MESAEFDIGDIHVADRLPEVFRDPNIRNRANSSLDAFCGRHNGELPLKYRMAEFAFDRPEQICTADSPEKLFAWDGKYVQLTADILGSLKATDPSVVLRSHPVDDAMKTPTHQIDSKAEIEDFQEHLRNPEHPSAIWDQFFAKIDPDNTVVQMLPNIYAQRGLILCRPFFIYDYDLHQEIAGFATDEWQKYYQDATAWKKYQAEMLKVPGEVPTSFSGIRLIPLDKFTREKKETLGAVAIYNPSTQTLEIKSDFPDILDPVPDPIFPITKGRTVDYDNENNTKILYGHRSVDPDIIHGSYGQEPLSLFEGDLEYLIPTLEWQLPRIFSFEKEIRGKNWIPQGATDTHQFVTFPPSRIGDNHVNTQYFDFRPHSSQEEMAQLAAKQDRDFDRMSTEDKIKMFF